MNNPSAGGVFRRILMGIGANALTQIAIAVIQIISVPVLIQSWGVAKYGTWLMIFTLPAALSVSDIGFSTAAGNDMAMKYARKDNDALLRVYQSLFSLVFVIAAIIALLSAIIVSLGPDAWFPTREVSDADHIRFAFLALALYAMAGLYGSVFLAGLRCSGHYASGTFVMALVLLCEGGVLMLSVHFTRSFFFAALGLFGVRCAGVVILRFVLRTKVPWLIAGYRNASIAEMRRLLRPALAVMSLAVSDMISLQGTILVVGKLVSPAAVAIFSTTRTLTRVGVLTTTLFNSTFLPEFSAAIATNNGLRKAQLIAANLLVVTAVAIVTFVGFGFYGRDIIEFWTHGHVIAPLSVILLLTAASNLRSVWQSGAVILLSANRHGSYAPSFLIVSTLTMVAAGVLSHAFEIAGAAASVVGMEAVMLILVSRIVRDAGLIDGPLVFQSVRSLPRHIAGKLYMHAGRGTAGR